MKALPDTLGWRILETMLMVRRFEEAVLRLSSEGHFAGHFHLYIGQEATAAVAMTLLREGDHLATTHRNHGHVIARGANPGFALAEILGRATGLNGGMGGTLHLCDPDLGFISTSAIVGGCIGLAVGAAYACKQRRDGSLTVAFFGDGALEEGVSAEALNIAALWKLPIVFMCENNSGNAWGPAKGGYPTLIHASQDLCSIPRAVGIEAIKVDGADTAELHAALAHATAHCRAGGGPVFVEAITNRWDGSNPLWPEPVTGVTDIRMAIGDAPTDGPHQEWYEQRDPVLRLARSLAGGGASEVARLRSLDRETTSRIDAAAEFALNSPVPAAERALEGVFA